MESNRTQDIRYQQYASSAYRDNPLVHNLQVDPNRSTNMTPTSLSVSIKSNTVDTLSSRPRMSLLPQANDILQYRSNHLSSMPVSEANVSHSCLRIDTRDYGSTSGGSYHPMVEAISPTNEETNTDEIGNAKNELLSHMNKINSEITETEKTIASLKKKQEMLEETASLKADTSLEEYSETPQKHRNLAQKIYAENKRKAATAHAIFNTLGPAPEFPLYNQPQDASICKDIVKYHDTFKERLKLHIKNLKQEKYKSRIELVEEYSKLSQEWNRRVEKLENNIKRKAKDAKSREFFEKVFPELRKQREDKERFNRVGSRIKSEADVEEIIDGLQEQALEDKKMRSYAVIPPLMLDSRQRKVIFFNENGAFGSMEKELKERSGINVWTSGEEEIFREKYLQHPKNFGAIAASLDRKNAQDCVRHYYISKKRENYKQLLRKSRQRTRSSRNPHKSSQNLTPSIIDAMTTGVVTRLQREQQKSVTKERSTVASNFPTEQNINENIQLNTANLQTAHSDSGTSLEPMQNDDNTDSTYSKDVDTKNSQTKNKEVPSSDGDVVLSQEPLDKTALNESVETRMDNTAPSSGVQERNCITSFLSVSAIPIEVSTSKDNEDEQSGEESDCKKVKIDISDGKVSGAVETSTTLKSNNNKFRYTTCPLASCQNGKERVTRFRNIPSKLFELPSESKDYIMQEFKIPENVTKCCSSCVLRIRKCLRLQKHCAVFGEGEIMKMKSIISEHGLNWKILADQFKKPENVLKLFFILNKKRFNSNECGAEYSHTFDVNLIDFSEDDSDVSATSSEEREAISSDTASAESPKASTNSNKIKYIIDDSEKTKETVEDDILIPPLNQPPKRQKTQEEYDSSATETADEENEVTPINQLSPKSAVQYPFQNVSNQDNVRDIIGNVIEKAIKEPSMVPTPPMKSSGILENRSDQSIIRENFQLISSKPESTIITSQTSILNKGTNSLITNTSTPSNQSLSKHALNCNVINVDLGNDNLNPNSIAFGKSDNDAHTLDLSVKKGKDMHPSQMIGYHQAYIKSEDIKHPEANQTTLIPSQNISPYLSYEQAEKMKLNQSQLCYSSTSLHDGSNNSNNNGNNCSSNSNNALRGPSHAIFTHQKGKIMSKMNSKPLHHSQISVTKGSITQGIPVSNPQVVLQARYDNIFHQTLSNSSKSGSITHGTPMAIGGSPQNVDKRVFEYYNNKNQMSPSHPQQISPQSSANFSSPSFTRTVPYIEHPQLSSKQIMMNDYITSQQMIGQHRNNRIEKEVVNSRSMNSMPIASSSIYYTEKDRPRTEYTNRTSPGDHNSVSSPQKTPPPQRQGVIQRHNKPPSPIKNRLTFSQSSYLAGHEAFSSLVDVASNQPHITVPHSKEDKRCMPMIPSDSSNTSSAEEFRYHMQLMQQRQQLHPMHLQQRQQSVKNKYITEYEKDRERREEELRDKDRFEREAREKERDKIRESMPIMHSTERELDKHRMFQQLKQEEFERIKFKTSDGDPECKFRPQITSRGDTTFTAANLINAIITHQISQNNNNDPPLLRESYRPPPQFIPSKENSANISTDCGKRASPNVINVEIDADSSSSSIVTKMKFGDLADSIINKDYGPSNQLRLKSVIPNQYQPQEVLASSSHEDQWKYPLNKRILLKDKHESHGLEKHQFSDETNLMKSIVPASPRNQSLIEPISPPESYDKRALASQSSEFALDCYVKSRIAEAMRTDTDKRHIDDSESKRGVSNQTTQMVKDDKNMEHIMDEELSKNESNEQRAQSSFSSASYAYPYSALSMSASSNSVIPISQVATIQNSEKQGSLVISNVSNIQKVIQDEPKPLLSSKYEALSDED